MTPLLIALAVVGYVAVGVGVGRVARRTIKDRDDADFVAVGSVFAWPFLILMLLGWVALKIAWRLVTWRNSPKEGK